MHISRLATCGRVKGRAAPSWIHLHGPGERPVSFCNTDTKMNDRYWMNEQFRESFAERQERQRLALIKARCAECGRNRKLGQEHLPTCSQGRDKTSVIATEKK